MSIPIVQSSSKAAEIAKLYEQQKHTLTVYPFDQLEVGQSFSVELDEKKYKSIHAIASRKGKMQKKKFVVIRHTDLNLLEVARIA